MQAIERVLPDQPDQREHINNRHKSTKNIQASQGHCVWESDRFLSQIDISIDSIRSLKQLIDAAMTRIENGLLDISPLTPEQEIIFFGGENA